MNKGAEVLCAYWGDTLVGFNSYLNMPSGTTKFSFRTHRLVILPDFQGLGIGTKFNEFVGNYMLSNGNKYFLRTTHIRLGNHCNASHMWKNTATNQVLRENINEQNALTTQGKKYRNLDGKRTAYSFEFVGVDYFTKPHKTIICDCDIDNAELYLDKYNFDDNYINVATNIASQSNINSWEKYCKSNGIRTDVLWIKRKSEYYINNNVLNDGMDLITTQAQFDSVWKDKIAALNYKHINIIIVDKEEKIVQERSKMDKKTKVLTFEKELKWIKNKDMRRFVIQIISELPDYFFVVPASSTGKYHPSYSLGNGGLARHTKAAVLIAHTLLELEQYKNKYTAEDRDIIITSLLLHDGVKQGLTANGYTRTTHPIDMANFIKNHKSNVLLDKDILATMCGCIASHMGEFNKDYKTGKEVLPKPQTDMEKFVHMCDYLASRKFLEVNFDKVEYYE